MKNPNGFGSVYKLSGKRRKPYAARVTVDSVYDPDKEDYVQKKMYLGYYRTKAEAIAALSNYAQNPYSLLEANMTIGQIWDNIKDKVKASDNRRTVYNTVVSKYFGSIINMRIKDVKTKHLQQVIDDCEYGYSTKSNIRVVMHHIFSYACQNDLVDKDYTDYIKFEQEKTMIERVVYTPKEVEKLWKYKDMEEYKITLVLLYQGMRIKELMDLKKENIDLEHKTIDIVKAKNKYSIRMIPIHDKVYPIIKDLIASSEDEYVTHIKIKNYEYFTKNTLGHTAYDSRHSFASRCHELDLKPLVIQRLMGHKPDNILGQVYTHLSIDELREAINQVNW